MRALERRASWVVLPLALAVAGAALAADWDPNQIKAPPLRPIQKIEPARKTLKNGVVVYLLEDHTLPMVRGIAYARYSPTWIPDSKVGLGGITGEVMRSGGTQAHSGDWLDDHLAAIGASITTELEGAELASAGFRCLSDNVSEVVGLWSEVMRVPAFPDDKIELSKVGLRRAIAERNDELIPVLLRVIGTALYGKGNIWARYPEYATVEAVSRGDCRELHRKMFDPSRLVVAIYGDFRSQDMLNQLNAKLGDWKGAGVPVPPTPPVPTDSKPRLVFAPKDDVTQSGIVAAQVGFRADDPDYPAMDVYQTVLGGGWQSRLMNKIRSERGLAYAAGAQAGEDYTRPGIFLAYSLTKSESTMTALELLRQEVRRSVTEPLTNDEVSLARNTVENTFVFKFEKPSDILFRAAYYEAIGYPQDFLQRYQQGLRGVTVAGVGEAARRKVHPERQVIVIVGKEKDFDHKLESAGLPVERVDISIPPPPPAAKPTGVATPDQLERGKKWLTKASELAGGSAAWKAIKSLKLEAADKVTMEGQSIKLKSQLSWRLPNRLLSVQLLPFGVARVGFDGTTGWGSMGPQVREDPNIGIDVGAEWERSLFHVFGHPDDVALRAADDPQSINGVAYRVGYAKTAAGQEFTLYFAPDGSLARVDFVGHGPRGDATQTEILSDWKPVGAIRYPHRRELLIEGQPYLESSLNSLMLDPPLEDSLFKKPGS
jgi:zinc protease